MRAAVFLVPILLIAGCAANVCPDNLNITSDWSLSYEDRPNTQFMDKVFDSSVSNNGEVYELLIYNVGNGSYYVQYNPVRSFGENWYGPYPGDPLEDLSCQ